MHGIFAIIAVLSCAPAQSEDFKKGMELGRELAEMRYRLERIEKTLAELQKELERANKSKKTPEPAEPVDSVQPTQTEPVLLPVPEIRVPPVEEPQRSSKLGTVAGSIRVALGEARAEAYVFLADYPAPLVQNKTAKIEQVNRQFSPRFLVVQKGTRVEFPNRDAIYHNVFSISDGNKFDVGYSRSGDIATAHRFVTPGVVDIFCNMHSEMSATLVVAPNDKFTRVKEDGSFSMKVPAGRRRLVLVAARGRRSEVEVDVLPDRTVAVSFDVISAAGDRGHKRKDGTEYPY
jgi:plastocyanin